MALDQILNLKQASSYALLRCLPWHCYVKLKVSSREFLLISKTCLFVFSFGYERVNRPAIIQVPAKSHFVNGRYVISWQWGRPGYQVWTEPPLTSLNTGLSAAWLDSNGCPYVPKNTVIAFQWIVRQISKT